MTARHPRVSITEGQLDHASDSQPQPQTLLNQTSFRRCCLSCVACLLVQDPGGTSEELFEGSKKKSAKSDEPEVHELYEQIGRLKVEVEWLKKKASEQ